MKLPEIQTPLYSLNLPSNGKKIEYRPFLVKEEKLLLITNESRDNKEIINSIKQLIEACTFNKLNVDNITSYDLEYIFLKLRAKSVGEKSDLMFTCSQSGESFQVTVNLDEIEPTSSGEVSNMIKINEDISIKLRPLRVKDMAIIDEENSSLAVSRMIETIYEGEKEYDTSDATDEELLEFVNNFSLNVLDEVTKYAESMPKLVYERTVKSPAGYDNLIKLEGVQDFF